MKKDSSHLQWLHDRIINVYKENENVDFLIKFREIIDNMKKQEDEFEKFLKMVEEKRKKEK